MPISFLFPQAKGVNKKEAIGELKENKKKKWMKVNESLSLNINSAEYLTNRELVEKAYNQATEDAKRMMRGKQHHEFYLEFIQHHNTINRMTMTTGEGMFAPYTETNYYYYPETELAVFFLLDEDATDIGRKSNVIWEQKTPTSQRFISPILRTPGRWLQRWRSSRMRV